MSQSATLYSVIPEKFLEVEKANGKKVKPLQLTDEYICIQGSFDAIVFILSKGRTQLQQALISEIFAPKAGIGGTDISTIDFASIEEEELWNLMDCVEYLSPDKVQAVSTLLETITEQEVSNSYNAQELNTNGIYPEVWHDDNSEDQAYNKRHVLEDFTELKFFFQKAAMCQNFVLCYAG